MGLLSSKSAAQHLMEQGSLCLNNKRDDSEEKRVEEVNIIDGKVLVLSAG